MNKIKTNRLPAEIGFWSAILSATTMIVYTLCFVAILIVNPLFIWTNFPDYIASTQTNNQFFIHLAQLMSLFLGPLYVLMLHSLHEYAADDRKILARISIGFGLVFATLTGMHYFVQLSAVRLNILYGRPDGLEQFVQANPLSALAAINMLGWSLFLGLSSLFVAPLFSGGKLEKIIKIAFLLNGICCLLGGIGYIFQMLTLLFLTINLGMGGAIIVISITLAVWFRRMNVTPQ